MRKKLRDIRRRMRRLANRAKPGTLCRAAALLLALSVFMFCLTVYKKAIPIARMSAETVARGEIERIVLEAARNAIKNIDEDLYFHVRDSEGRLVNLSANSREVSELCSGAVSNVNELIKERRYIKIKVPLGSVLGSSFLHGTGPSVSVRALPYAAAYADVESSFTEAGINQTLYSLILVVKTEVTLVCADENISFETVTRINLSEEVIVGNVPGGVFR